jgi:hypothetical protein
MVVIHGRTKASRLHVSLNEHSPHVCIQKFETDLGTFYQCMLLIYFKQSIYNNKLMHIVNPFFFAKKTVSIGTANTSEVFGFAFAPSLFINLTYASNTLMSFKEIT